MSRRDARVTFLSALALGTACASIGCDAVVERADTKKAEPRDMEPQDRIVLTGKNLVMSYKFDLIDKKEIYSFKNTVGDMVNVKVKVVGTRQKSGFTYSKECIWGKWALDEVKDVDAADFSFDDARLRRPNSPTVGWRGIYAGPDGLLTGISMVGTAKMNDERVSIKVSNVEWPALHEFDLKGEVSGNSVSVAVTHKYKFSLVDVDMTCYCVLDSGERRFVRKEVKEWKPGDVVRIPVESYKEVQLCGFAKKKMTETLAGMPIDRVESVRILTDWSFGTQ